MLLTLKGEGFCSVPDTEWQQLCGFPDQILSQLDREKPEIEPGTSCMQRRCSMVPSSLIGIPKVATVKDDLLRSVLPRDANLP